MGGVSGAGRRGGPARRIDAGAMGVFLKALKRGAVGAAAAREAGFHVSSFYRRREADPDFAAAWAEAEEIGNTPMFLSPMGGRRLQLRKTRKVRFTDQRREVFLAHFAGTCDLKAAAEAAGVCGDTVNNHRRKDVAFAEACQAALEQGFARLEEEAVRQRMEAQERLAAGIMPQGEVTAEFERLIKLLAHWTRRGGRPGLPAARRNGQGRTWSFDEAVTELARRLRALRIPIARDGGIQRPASGGVEVGPLQHPRLKARGGPPPRSGEDL